MNQDQFESLCESLANLALLAADSVGNIQSDVALNHLTDAHENIERAAKDLEEVPHV